MRSIGIGWFKSDAVHEDHQGVTVLPSVRVDLFSDNLAKPTPEMRQFMCEAPVGDETKHEDPTVNLLLDMAIDLLGKEAAVFMPTGTMCNETAFAVHCRPGDEIFMDKTAHPLHYEGGGPAALAGVSIQTLDGDNGIFSADQLRSAIRPPSRFFPRPSLVSVEQFSMLGGGRIWSLEQIHAVTDVARESGLATHLDGARLLIASAATGVPAAAYAAPFDSVWISLDKAIAAPVGAVMAGSKAFIEDTLYWKLRVGGSWRQPGIIAAGGVYALQHNVERIPELLENARLLAELLRSTPGIEIEPESVTTDIVFFEITDPNMSAAAFQQHLLDEYGIRVSVMGPQLVRMCMNLDVSTDDVREAAASIREVFTKAVATARRKA